MKISAFLRLVFRREDRMNATVALAMAVQALISVLGPASVQLLGNIVDLAFARERVGMQVFCYILICALSFLLALVKSKANSSIECSIERTLRESVIHRLYSDMKGKHKHGEIYTLAVNQSEEFAQDACQLLLSAVDFGVTCSIVFGLMLQVNARISLTALPLLALLSVLTMAIMRMASRTHLIRQEGSRKFTSMVSEEISLLKEMRIFPMLNLLSTRYDKAEREKFDADVKHARAVFFSLCAERVSNAIAFSFMICFSAFLLRKGELSNGQILVLINYVSALLFQLSQINYIVDMWMSNQAIYEKIVKIGADFRSNTGYDGGTKIGIRELSMRGIRVCYDQKTVLEDFSTKIRPGEKVALMGPSGVGKTSLIKAILGLVPITGGEISVDQNRKVNVHTRRESVAYLSQTPFFFSGTVFENLQWANPALTRVEALKILKIVNLAHLPLDRVILEKGMDLSGGERQRLSFARCIAKDVTFWVLDEPFAQLDKANEEMLCKNIKNAAGISMLVSTHEDVSHLVDRVITLKRRR